MAPSATYIWIDSLHNALPISQGTVVFRDCLDSTGDSMAPSAKYIWIDGGLKDFSQGTVPFINAGNSSRSEEHTSELQSQSNLVCRLLLEKKKKIHLLNAGKST